MNLLTADFAMFYLQGYGQYIKEQKLNESLEEIMRKQFEEHSAVAS